MSEAEVEVKSGATRQCVLELYTSDGCSSCPPAERFISNLKSQVGVTILSFHVDYWDYLGWPDAYGSVTFSSRQRDIVQWTRQRSCYTPQILVDMKDTPSWGKLRAQDLSANRPAASVDIVLTRKGAAIDATVTPKGGAPTRLAAYWAVTQNNLTQDIKKGENRGLKLSHDFVVRQYAPVTEFRGTQKTSLNVLADLMKDGCIANLVVFDPATGVPLQALGVNIDAKPY